MISLTFLRVFNGMITLLFFPFILKIYSEKREKFYLYWGIGFFLYGVNILIRSGIFYSNSDPNTINILAFLVYSIGFSFIIVGLGSLINRTMIFAVFSLAVPFGMIVLYLIAPYVNAARIIGILPFIYLCIILLYIRQKYAIDLDLFILGWILLLFVNTALLFEVISDSVVEVLAIFIKIILFIGMRTPKFSLLANDFERFIISGKLGYIDDPTWHLTMVESRTSKAGEIQWMTDIIELNKTRGIRTILITVYDVLTINDLQANNVTDLEDVYVIRMHQKGRIQKDSFREQVMSINDDLGELGIIIDDIISFSNEKKIRCNLIIHSVSTLVHIHGIKRVYTLLLSKIPSLKESLVQSYLLYYPQSHNDQFETNQLLMLVDEKITIQ